jgi:WD40 repeat protein
MTDPSIPEPGPGPTARHWPFVAGLVLAVAAFAAVWSRGSLAPKRVAVAHAAPDQTGETKPGESPADRVIWSCEGIVAGALAFSPDDKYLAAILYNSPVRTIEDRLRQHVLVIDSDSAQTLFTVSELRPVALSFLSDSGSIAVLCYDSIHSYFLRVHDFASQTLTFETQVGPDRAPSFEEIFLGTSTAGRFVAVQTWDASRVEKYQAWDVDRGEPVPYTAVNYRWSGDLISPDGELIAHGGWPGPGIRVSRAHFDEDRSRKSVSFCFRAARDAKMARDGKPEPIDHETRRLRNWTEDVSFSPDSKRLLIVYKDGTLIDWKITGGMSPPSAQIGKEGAFENCASIALSHAGDRLAYSHRDGTIRILRVVGD